MGKAKSGKDGEVEEFLRSALPLVREEAATTAWFAIRFGRSEYGIFDVFPNSSVPNMNLLDVQAEKLAGGVTTAKA